MKKLLMLVCASAVLAGCGIDAEVRTGLFQAQSVLKQTIREADAKAVAPWALPESETPEAHIIRLERQREILLDLTMRKVKGLLDAYVKWDTGKELKEIE